MYGIGSRWKSSVEPMLGCVVEQAACICSILLVKRAPNTLGVMYSHLAPVVRTSHPRAVKSEEGADAEAKYKCWSSAEKYMCEGVEKKKKKKIYRSHALK